jgi:hypothetical protein
MLEFPADDLVPQRVLLQSRTDIVPAVLELLRRARHQVRCLHHDLSVFELSQATIVEALHTFVHASRHARVRLLVEETGWLDSHAARLRLLQRQLAHAIEMRRASTDDPVGEDAAFIADDSHVLVLARSAHALGEIWFNSEPRAHSVVTGFDRRWEAAAHNLPVDPLGL